MPNIALHVDEDVIRKIRKIALARNTTLTAMVRRYLQSLAGRDEAERERHIDRLWYRDSLIVAAAERAACAKILSEDL